MDLRGRESEALKTEKGYNRIYEESGFYLSTLYTYQKFSTTAVTSGHPAKAAQRLYGIL